ncbi:pilus assembly protein CpaA [Vibrio vulnificus]|uniref:A24 family peptidase n=1 Tax=Vibrio vulnificus TaxID=672 RepID=UPI000CD1329B|nr:prepilin peptidase [Vibrio vulnificus]EGR0107094.1 prepilin peptidase [Vibrio vulnificus]EHV9834714.1 prepilin peptidase [Vibrio vulnificus]EJE8691805.1 prepilin peptidase [Vibrio vulnificus]POB17216.1 pilus assembly protein CpaA [Vibrio vulnificus]HAS6019661.1 pilus assembly protein CpaA [Vibrio vulnificus]
MTLFLISALAIYASMNDIKYRVIPNGAILAMLFLCTFFAHSSNYLLQTAPISALCFALSITLWHKGFFGGGDAKYFPAMMLGIKPEHAIEAICYIGLFGGITVIGVYVYCLIAQKEIKKIGIPYGLPISLSCLIFLNLSSM